MFTIYLHKNKENGKVYIGQTSQLLHDRFLGGWGYTGCPRFFNAIKHYGWQSFETIILEENIEDQKEALELEAKYINQYDSTNIDKGYNLLSYDENLHIKHSPETLYIIGKNSYKDGRSDPKYVNFYECNKCHEVYVLSSDAERARRKRKISLGLCRKCLTIKNVSVNIDEKYICEKCGKEFILTHKRKLERIKNNTNLNLCSLCLQIKNNTNIQYTNLICNNCNEEFIRTNKNIKKLIKKNKDYNICPHCTMHNNMLNKKHYKEGEYKKYIDKKYQCKICHKDYKLSYTTILYRVKNKIRFDICKYCLHKFVQIGINNSNVKNRIRGGSLLLGNNYDENSIVSLGIVGGVRKRYQMYIDGSGQYGILKLLYEIIANSNDEASQGYCNEINITINSKTKELSVFDNGRGIPIGSIDQIMLELHSGGKFDQKGYEFSTGMNGCGLFLTNCLSVETEVQVWRDNQHLSANYSRGEKIGNHKIETISENKHGTFVKFKPDIDILFTENNGEIFDGNLLDKQLLLNILDGLSHINPGIHNTIHFFISFINLIFVCQFFLGKQSDIENSLESGSM